MVSLVSTQTHVHQNVADSFKSGHIHIHPMKTAILQIQRCHIHAVHVQKAVVKKIKM